MRKPRWSDYPSDDHPGDETAALIAAPEPRDDPPAVPIFGVGPFTPRSRCPHFCKLCRGHGSLVVHATGESLTCPDCEGTGRGRLPEGSVLYCPVCDAHGMDGGRSLPLGVAPLPADPPEPATDESEAA